mmetsp:Transcript_11072/g.23494  ORF Transcript_11072/g.23494 Transcript_11072/m.23494 type:complete len:260 (+) Transcript_11072:1-780(+)
MSGSEDGNVFIWQVETGECVKSAWNVGFKSMCVDVAWHPNERMIVAISFTPRAPVLLYKYERDRDDHTGKRWEEVVEMEVRDTLAGKWRDLAGAFRELDADKDGQLSLMEFKIAMVRMELGLGETQMETLFRRTDSDGSGKIDFVEFVNKFASPEEAQLIVEDSQDKRPADVDAGALTGKWGDLHTLISDLSKKTASLRHGLREEELGAVGARASTPDVPTSTRDIAPVPPPPSDMQLPPSAPAEPDARERRRQRRTRR